MPIFGSSRATSKPGRVGFDDERGDPAWPASGSVFANTVYSPATPAFVMKRFEPSSTYSSPSRRAVVRIAAESEPEPGLGQRVRREHFARGEPRQPRAAAPRSRRA